MKIKVVPTVITVLLCALIAYGIYSGCKNEEMRLLVSIFGGICMLLTAGTVLGVSLERSRTSVNVKVVSGVFACIFLLTSVIYCFFSTFSVPLYIIIHGLLLLTWLLVVYGIARAKM